MQDTFPILERALHASAASTVASVVLRLLVAAALGGMIGLEREMKHRPAGLRTNMFICFGSALFTMLSALLAGVGQDETRIAAQIIAGIGFIGAGSILHSRGGVQGVTTAATIYVVAAIGMCAGSGLMIPAAVATVLVIFGLIILGILEAHVFLRSHPAAYQVAAASAGTLYLLLENVPKEKQSKLLDVKFTTLPAGVQLEFTLEALPATHEKLRSQLRGDFEAHKVILFSSSEQE
jgi:putative Mg2+ transporter-C (MgtC) family protein